MRTILLTALLTTAVAVAEQPPAKKASVQRKVRFNKHLLGPAELEALERLERGIGRLDDGAYWYDPRTGASGRWGGPTLAFLPPDAQGNYGLENGPALGNLALLARAHQGSGGRQAWSKHYEGTSPGGNMNLASDGTTTCVSTANYSRCTGE